MKTNLRIAHNAARGERFDTDPCASRAVRSARELLALGMFGRGSRVGERIARLLERGRGFSPRVSRARVAASAVALLGCAIAGAILPKTVAFAQRMEFEVASVKPVSVAIGLPSGFSMLPRRSGDRVAWITNPQLVIRYAYKLGSFQLGQEKWLNAFYDIEAKFPASATEDQVRLMFQALLEDRFKLKLHWDTKQLPVYSLTVARGGPKLTEWKEGSTPRMVIGRPVLEGYVANYSSQEDPHHVAGRRVSTSALATYFADALHSPVLDKTGLSEDYDFELVWTSEERPLDPPDPAIVSDAMQRQLGLRLDAGKGPVDVLLIDRLEKPDAN